MTGSIYLLCWFGVSGIWTSQIGIAGRQSHAEFGKPWFNLRHFLFIISLIIALDHQRHGRSPVDRLSKVECGLGLVDRKTERCKYLGASHGFVVRCDMILLVKIIYV